jgi:hypothetical protein
MFLRYPNRVAAVWLRSNVPLQLAEPFPAAALDVPVMCNLGAKEGVTTTTNRFALAWPLVQEFFAKFRQQGGLVGVAVDPNSEHDCGNSRYLAIPWFDACLTARLPEEAGSAGLKLMPTEDAWLAPLLGKVAQPTAEFAGDTNMAVWLPNGRIAKAWGEFVRDGNVGDPTPPPPPHNVRVSSTGDVAWEAEADVESGIAEFVIERDGKRLARVPEKHLGYFVGRPTFQRIGYGDEPAVPLAKMRFSDSTARRGKKHIYAVRTVNTVGLTSEPTVAVATTSLGGDQRPNAFPEEVISKQWTKGPEVVESHVTVELDTTQLDACVGQYKFAPSALFPSGATLRIWRDGNQLTGQPSAGGVAQNPFVFYPTSGTNFFLKLDGSQLTFIKNDRGEATAVIHRSTRGGIPDQLGQKAPDVPE